MQIEDASSFFEDVGFNDTGDRWGNAGSGILFTTGTRILLLLRSDSVEEPGTWGIPGGAIPQKRSGEFEDAYISAKREVREELGSVPVHRVVDQYVYQENNFQYTTFIAEVDPSVEETLHPRFNWENDDYAWISLDELGAYDLHFGTLEVLNHVNPFIGKQQYIKGRFSSRIASSTEKILYHGSSKLFSSFKSEIKRFMEKEPVEVPIFLTPSMSFAKLNAGYNGYVYTIVLSSNSKLFSSTELYNLGSRFWPPENDNLTTLGKDLMGSIAGGHIYADVDPENDYEHGEILKGILSEDYDSMESNGMMYWLKQHHYDGFHVQGDGVRNIAIFDPDKLYILSVCRTGDYGTNTSVIFCD